MALVTEKCIMDIEYMRKHFLGPNHTGKVLMTDEQFRRQTEGEPIPGHQPEFQRDCVEEDKLMEIGVIPEAWVKRHYLEMCDAHKRKSEGYTVKEKAKWELNACSAAWRRHIRRRMLEVGLNPEDYLK